MKTTKQHRLICTLLSPLILVWSGTASPISPDLGKKVATQGNNQGAAACVGCHGLEGGGSPATGFPRLAGLNAAYLLAQLQAFKKEQRRSTLMGPIAKALSPEEMQAVATYYAHLKPPRTTDSKQHPGGKFGRDLAFYGNWIAQGLPACNSCHGLYGQGVGKDFPPLAGQQYDYIVEELKKWKSGKRTGDPLGMMAAVADKLSEKQIGRVAAYYASLDPDKLSALNAATPKKAATRQETTPEKPADSVVHPAHKGEVSHHGDAPEGRPITDTDHFRPPSRKQIPEGRFGNAVRLGEAIFSNTATHPISSPYVGNEMTCESCHLDAGRLAKSSPMWASWVAYPAYRKKTHKVNTQIERIQGCFRYSMNAQNSRAGGPPPADSDTMIQLVSYFYWLATGAPTGDQHMPGRGYPRLKETAKGFDPERGKVVYKEKCAICHGPEGQGRSSFGQVTFPPLWGKESYNWGAGMHKVDVAAAFIKWNMPFGLPGTLGDQETWDVAAFINSHERPQDPRHKGNFQETVKKFHSSRFDYYGKRKGPDGRLLGEGATRQ